MALWYEGVEGLDDTTTGFIKAQGLDALDAPQAAAKAIVALYGATQKLGGDPNQLLRLPTDPNDAAGWGAVHERLGVPKEASAYDFSSVKRADGSPAAPAFIEHVRTAAFANKMTPAQAVAFANAQLGYEAKGASDDVQRRTVTNQLAVDELKSIHGENYPVFEFKARRAGEAMGISKATFDLIGNAHEKGLAGFLTEMYNFGQKMSESDLLGNKQNPGGTPAYTPQEAAARKETLSNDPVFRARFTAGETEAISEMQALSRIAHRRPV